jgi:hypothetical protein
MTPAVLARELGLSIPRIDGILHELFPRTPAQRYTRWDLTDDQADAVRARVGRRTARSTLGLVASAEPATSAWYWEGNVQAAIATHLARRGWQVIRVADTARKERGDDILARRDGRDLVIEVKGYPSVAYADPARVGEIKAAAPTLQAHHWLADAVLKSLRLRGTRPEADVAIGLPRLPRYERLLDEIAVPLRDLGVGVYLVDEDGSVAELAAPAAGPPR